MNDHRAPSCGTSGSRTPRRIVASFSALALLASAGCAAGSSDRGSGSAEWVGTITTQAGVTTVINESGSVWPGRGQLVEEAVIGVEAGPEEYMFGGLFAVMATDEHIYVTDEQVDRVRRYDLNGVFVDNIGEIGQGPGEYGDPAMVAVMGDGRIIVFDFAADRMLEFAADGASLDTWPAPDTGCCGWQMLSDTNGALWVPTVKFDPETGQRTYALQVFGPDGPGEPRYRVEDHDARNTEFELASVVGMLMPFAPQFTWTPAGPGRVLAGFPETYRFEIQEHGEIVRVVEKYGERVPVDAAHRDWRRKSMIALGRRFDPSWSWNGDGMPTRFPAYASLIASGSGEIWVVRHGPAVNIQECADPLAEDGPDPFGPSEPCWQDTYILDVFDPEGRFLGEVDVPSGVSPHPLRMHIDGDRVVAILENELGIYQVKRYRLIRPE